MAEVLLPECGSAWSVAIDGERLYVTDAAPHTSAARHDEEHEADLGLTPGGQLFILDLLDPRSPVVRGAVTLAGLPKGIATLPEQVIALASGQAGIELVDASDPDTPTRLGVVDTPGSAVGLAYDDGYLLVADWTSLRLYDVNHRGSLRPLWGSDLALAQQMPPHPYAPYAMDYSQFVGLQGETWIGSDMDSIWVGRVERGRRDATTNLIDRRVAVNARADAPDEGAFALRLANGGRTPLIVTLDRDAEGMEHVDGDALVLPPLGSDLLRIDLGGVHAADAAEAVHLRTSDPENSRRRIQIARIEDGYSPGDPIPEFRLPGINECQEGGPCDLTPRCVEYPSAEFEGAPVLLAFWSSW